MKRDDDFNYFNTSMQNRQINTFKYTVKWTERTMLQRRCVFIRGDKSKTGCIRLPQIIDVGIA